MKSKSPLTIGQKISLGFAGVLLLTLVLSIASVVSLRSIKGTLPQITDDALPGLAGPGQLGALVSEIQLDVLRHLLAPTMAEKQKHEASLETKKKEISEVLANLSGATQMQPGRAT